MRDAPGDVGPSRGALGGHKIADVVERDDAGAAVASRTSGHPNVEHPLAAVPQDGRLPLVKPQPQRPGLLPDRPDARLDGVEGPPDKTELAAEQPVGGGV